MSDPHVHVSSLTFNNGDSINLEANEIVVIVGPNNSGKSEMLRNIIELLRLPKSEKTVILKNLQVTCVGTSEDVANWIKRTSKFDSRNNHYQQLGSIIRLDHLKHFWDARESQGLNNLVGFFAYHITTESRIKASNAAKAIALTTEPFSHPIHYLQYNDETEKLVSDLFKEAFDNEVIVHRNAGNRVPLHIGAKPTLASGEDRVSRRFNDELEMLPEIESQGDGMRAFLGVILHSIVVDNQVLLLDEPEAFLHPPQARKLGRMLGERIPKSKQVFISTHSGDFLRGLLDSGNSRVKIIRISRKGVLNLPFELDNSRILEIWRDSILRHSDILNGVFHERVFICESDSDCRFYSVLLNCTDTLKKHFSDTMFTYSGGKHRISVVNDALRALGVETHLILDFDALSEKGLLEKILRSCSGDFSQIESDWFIFSSAVKSRKPQLDASDVKRELKPIVDGLQNGELTEEVAEKIKMVIKRSSPWSLVKESGKNFVPSGDAFVSLGKILSYLSELGIHIVPVGEVEQFCKSIGGHGPSWVNKVLDQHDLATSNDLEDARKFAESILESILSVKEGKSRVQHFVAPQPQARAAPSENSVISD
jgi:energy-coupling factor transporter ATP-binding protein EcfA2